MSRATSESSFSLTPPPSAGSASVASPTSDASPSSQQPSSFSSEATPSSPISRVRTSPSGYLVPCVPLESIQLAPSLADSRPSQFNLGGVNGSGQVPQSVTSRLSLVDPDTPPEAYTKMGVQDPNEIYDLVWSDEFEVDGRSFYPGDDREFLATTGR